jgi:hypothetical protein
MANKAQFFSLWSAFFFLGWALLKESMQDKPSVGVIAICLSFAGMQTLSVIYNLLRRVKSLEAQMTALSNPPVPSNANPTSP